MGAMSLLETVKRESNVILHYINIAFVCEMMVQCWALLE